MESWNLKLRKWKIQLIILTWVILGNFRVAECALYEGEWKIRCEPPESLCPQMWNVFAKEFFKDLFPVANVSEPLCKSVSANPECWEFHCSVKGEDWDNVGNASDCAIAGAKFRYKPERNLVVETEGQFSLQVSGMDPETLAAFTDEQVRDGSFHKGRWYYSDFPERLHPPTLFEDDPKKLHFPVLVHKKVETGRRLANVTVGEKYRHSVEYELTSFAMFKLNMNETCSRASVFRNVFPLIILSLFVSYCY